MAAARARGSRQLSVEVDERRARYVPLLVLVALRGRNRGQLPADVEQHRPVGGIQALNQLRGRSQRV